MKPNNGKNRSVTYPELFSVYPSVRSAFHEEEEKKEIYRVVFQNFGLKWLEGKQDFHILVPKWPSDGPSYDNATTMFSIKNVCYQRIKYETFYKLRTEKFKNTMLYKP